MRLLVSDGEAMGLSYIELQATALGAGVYRAVGFEEKEQHYTPMIRRYREKT